MRNTSLILTVMLCAAMGLQAQNLPFRNYTIANGLSESVVNALEQDNEGYLWIGTSYGLNRFDGRHFQNYYTEQGLENNEIYALYEDREGHIWIGTGSGVNVFASDSIYSISELEPLQKDRKSTRLNSSHVSISYAVFCLKKKKKIRMNMVTLLNRRKYWIYYKKMKKIILENRSCVVICLIYEYKTGFISYR